MSELHSMSMAYYSSNSLALGGPGLGLGLGLGGGNWDSFHNFDLAILSSSDTMSSLLMDGFDAPPCVSTLSDSENSDFSTGYLEDALVEFSERSKRRRMLLFNDDNSRDHSTSSFVDSKAYWNSEWEMCESFDSISQLITTSAAFSGEDDPSSNSSKSYTPTSKIDTDETNIADTKMSIAKEEAMGNSSSSSCNSAKESASTNPIPAVDTFPAAEEKRKKKREVMTSRVMYPFAVVKPGGVEGDVTLNDINKRISMRPTRLIRHPVGDFACRPCVSDAHGPGLSGKAVVALTRIQTQGRGTITIIRTRG